MRLRLVATLALLCACRGEGPIHRERIELVLWADRNQDNQCTSGELTSLDLAHAAKDSTGYGSYERDTALLANGARLVDVDLAVLR